MQALLYGIIFHYKNGGFLIAHKPIQKDCSYADIQNPTGDQWRTSCIQWKNNGAREFRLSLEKANLTLLARLGILEENITILQDCTCCNAVYGSNRRQTAQGELFTVQVAFCKRTVQKSGGRQRTKI